MSPKAGSSSTPRRMRSSAGTTAGDQTQPRVAAVDALLDYAYSGHDALATASEMWEVTRVAAPRRRSVLPWLRRRVRLGHSRTQQRGSGEEWLLCRRLRGCPGASM